MPVVEILTAIPKMDDRIFPSVRKLSDRSVSGFSRAKRRLDKIIVQADAERSHSDKRKPNQTSESKPWVLHDLRRTAVTGMAELGIQPHVVEAVVNHVSGHRSGVAGVNNWASYAIEKKNALNVWADHVMKLLATTAEADIPALEA